MGTRLYPRTTNRNVLCRLAGVPASTWEEMEGIDRQLEARRGQRSGSYVPRADEIVIGNMTDPEDEYGPAAHEITVRMPDGRIMLGNTRSQGEQEDDCSYLVYQWLKLYYPDVDDLKSFLLFGWGRVDFPWHMEYTHSGESLDEGVTEDILACMGVDLNGVPITDLEGVYWS